MDSIGTECKDLKKQYDTCFNQWFSDRFLRGVTDDSDCAKLFSHYQSCVKVAYLILVQIFIILWNAMKEQNIDFKEIEKDVLGSEDECKVPPKSEKHS